MDTNPITNHPAHDHQATAPNYPMNPYQQSPQQPLQPPVQMIYQQQAPQYGYAQPPQQARSGAQYVRQQKGHSVILLLLTDWITLYARTLYYVVSPNHYFHA